MTPYAKLKKLECGKLLHIPYREAPASRLPKFLPFVLAVFISLVIAIVFIKMAWGEEIDINAIIEIESSGNPLAISKAGCRGLMQISNAVLREYNDSTYKNYITTYEDGFLAQPIAYTKKDLFDPEINRHIGTWYIKYRIPQLLNHYHKPITTEYILWAYNAGIGNVVKGIKPRETVNYIKKYYGLAEAK